MQLTTNHVYDFLDRTLDIAPDNGFSLELSACYQVYLGYCQSLAISPEPYYSFLDECKRTYPQSFKQIQVHGQRLKPIQYLGGLTYIHPAVFKVAAKGVKYFLEKTTTGHIQKIIQQLGDDNLPQGIPEYWPDFARLCKIKSGNKMVFFSPYDYQVRIWELTQKHTKMAIVKSRQLGQTQVIISIFLHKACLNPAYTAAIFLRNKSDTTKIAMRNRQMVDSLKTYITNTSDSANFFKIQGGGDLHFMNSGEEGARSMDSVSDILLDEAAFNKNIESIVAASGAAQAMVEGESTRIVVSTPDTKYGWFYDLMAENNPAEIDFQITCEQVVAQKLPPFYGWLDNTGTYKIILHWRAHPIYSQHEDYVSYRQIEDGTTREKAEREYNLCFINSDTSIFAIEYIVKNMRTTVEAEYDPAATYYMGIDTASTGQNYTVGYVVKEFKVESPMGTRNGYMVVDCYRKNRTIHDQDMIGLAALVEKWHPTKVAIETVEGTGAITYQKLVMIYPQLDIIGVKTNDQNKPIMVAVMLTALQEQRFLFPKGVLAQELAIFSNVNGKFQAPAGKNDDCVMAALMCLVAAPFNEGDFRVVNALLPTIEQTEVQPLRELAQIQ
jgi:hypothetical protein